MPTFATYNSEGVQSPTYTDSKLLAANVPEQFTVPTDPQTGLKPRVVLFGKGAAADFYAQAFSDLDGADRAQNGTFAEYVTNGAFASDTGWTKGTGWTIAAGVATATGAISTVLSQPSAITLLAGVTYTVTYTVTAFTAGTVTVSVGGTAGTARGSAATFKETIVAGTTQILAFTGAGFTGSIDNVSVTPWTLGTGWTTDGSTAVATGAISTALAQTMRPQYQLVAGQTYLCTYTTTRSAGSIALDIGGGTPGATVSSSTTTAAVLTAGATQVITFTTVGFTGTVDNVTIIPCAAVPGDASSGLSAVQNPVGLLLDGNKTSVSVVSAGTPIVTASYYK